MLILMMAAAMAAPDGAQPMAIDDWQRLTIVQVAQNVPGESTRYLKVTGGDLDGDGAPDDAILAFDCHGDMVMNARYIVTPRDHASGLPTGRRQYAPIRIVKEWGPATPQLAKIRPQYDVKTLKGNEKRVTVRGWDPVKKEEIAATADDRWTPITLGMTGDLCPATTDAAAKQKATKTRSNIQNN